MGLRVLSQEMSDLCGDFVAKAPKELPSFFFGSGSCGRIVETPMQKMCGPRPERTGFFGPVAHRYHMVEGLRREL